MGLMIDCGPDSPAAADPPHRPKSLNGHAHTSPGARAARIWPLLWAALAGAAGLAAAPLEPNVLEEGIVVHVAERMSLGDHLYRDAITHTGPLPYEILAGLFRMLGAEIAAARGAVVVLQMLGTLALFALARRAGAGVFAHAAAAVVASAPILLIPLFSTFFYTTLSFYLGLLTAYAGLRAARSARWALTTGALLAAIALCKQSTGVVLTAALLPLACLGAPRPLRARRVAQISLGGGATALIALAVYALRGDLYSFVYAQVALPIALAGSDSFRAPFINLWPPGALDPAIRESWVMYLPSLYHLRQGLHATIGAPIVLLTQLLYALPFVALLATGLCAWAKRLPPAARLHAAFLLAMTLNLFPRADWGHLVVSIPPALVQLLLLFGDRSIHLEIPRAVNAFVVTLISVATCGVGLWLHDLAGAKTFGPRVPLRPISRATLSPAMPRAIQYLRARVRPREPIFVARQEPLLYFATETTNPTPFAGVLPGLREHQEPPILEALAVLRFAVMSDIDQPVYTYYSDELPAVWAYLERHFRIPADFPLDDASWIGVLERGPDRGETAIDLLAERSGARAWIAQPDGQRVPTPSLPQRLAARQLNRPLPVALGARGGGLDFDLAIPPDAVFQSGVGYRGLSSVNRRYIHPPDTTARVSIRPEGAEAFETLLAIAIDDRPAAGRRWRAVEADLSHFAGQRATLRLEFQTQRAPQPDALAWFGSPRIALRP
jgi:hypothetical protein